ncbi:hypothetical protein GQ53DRAFT_471863 [Thozetella sp. PMI_491]|nr:hypothetical protein GQ53DRAFT_471863 [Thozetella sp. PMI_491]
MHVTHPLAAGRLWVMRTLHLYLVWRMESSENAQCWASKCTLVRQFPSPRRSHGPDGCGIITTAGKCPVGCNYRVGCTAEDPRYE